jgi:hypothetical protein
MTADYILKLKNGTEIPLLYNTWAFKTYSERKGVEYEDLANGCGSQPDGSQGETLKTKHMPDILLIGAETYSKYNNKAFTYTDLDACMWMDELPWRTSLELVEIIKIFVGKLLNVDLNSVEVEKPVKKKKS